jgi:hypothetical protein
MEDELEDELEAELEAEFPTGPDPEWLIWCDRLLKQLVPEDMTRPASSRQGQLLVAAFTLRWEVRNAGANWEDKLEEFEACEEFVTRHLCDGTLGDKVAVFVRRTFAHLHQWMNFESKNYGGLYVAMNRVDELAYYWCRLHPEPIAPEVVSWERSEAPDTESSGLGGTP